MRHRLQWPCYTKGSLARDRPRQSSVIGTRRVALRQPSGKQASWFGGRRVKPTTGRVGPRRHRTYETAEYARRCRGRHPGTPGGLGGVGAHGGPATLGPRRDRRGSAPSAERPRVVGQRLRALVGARPSFSFRRQGRTARAASREHVARDKKSVPTRSTWASARRRRPLNDYCVLACEIFIPGVGIISIRGP